MVIPLLANQDLTPMLTEGTIFDAKKISYCSLNLQNWEISYDFQCISFVIFSIVVIKELLHSFGEAFQM